MSPDGLILFFKYIYIYIYTQSEGFGCQLPTPQPKRVFETTTRGFLIAAIGCRDLWASAVSLLRSVDLGLVHIAIALTARLPRSSSTTTSLPGAIWLGHRALVPFGYWGFGFPRQRSGTGFQFTALNWIWYCYIKVIIFTIGLLMFIAFLLVLAIHLVPSGPARSCPAFQHGISDTKADSAQEACCRPALVVSPSSRSSSPFTGATPEYFPGAAPTSFEGSNVFGPHCSHHVRNSTVALSGLQTAPKALSVPLPHLPTTLASCDGQDVRAPTWGAKISGGVRACCSWLGLQPRMGWQTTMESRTLAESHPYPEKGKEAQGSEDSQEQSSRRRKRCPDDAIPSRSQFWKRPTSPAITPAIDAMAGLCKHEPSS